jgi:hypothetical protein
VVNVGDYCQRRQETLEKMALAAAQKARFSKQAQSLFPMPSAERRIIHLTLAEESDVETASEGEGRNRCVIIRKKSVRDYQSEIIRTCALRRILFLVNIRNEEASSSAFFAAHSASAHSTWSSLLA